MENVDLEKKDAEQTLAKTLDKAMLDSAVLEAVQDGKRFMRHILPEVRRKVDDQSIDDRKVDRALRRLKAKGDVVYMGQGATDGWQAVTARADRSHGARPSEGMVG